MHRRTPPTFAVFQNTKNSTVCAISALVLATIVG